MRMKALNSPFFLIFLLTTFIFLRYVAVKGTIFDVDTLSTPPKAIFDWTPLNPWVNCTVTFDASFSLPDGGTIVNYTWNFGDGTPLVNETDPVTTHVYTAAGTYTVTLNVTDSEGKWGAASQPITVSPIFGPTASFTYSPPEPFVNGTTTFDASSSIPGWNGTANTPIVNYTWNFGDGTPLVNETDPITTHVYTKAGNYTVTLNVADTMGWWNTTSQTLAVHVEAVIHDIAIMSVTLSPTVVYTGRETVDIIVVVGNNGTAPETFNVTAAYHNITTNEWKTIETQNVTQLYPLSNETLTFTLNTSGLTLYQHYKIMAQTSEIPGDINSTDNTVIDGTIRVKLAGDANGDGWVDGIDLVMYLAPAFNSKEGDANWNLQCDFNGDGWVDGIDLVIYLAPNFGKYVLNKAPVAIFTESAENVSTGEVVYFDASTSYDLDGTIVSYFWDFGDGTNATGVTVQHAYTVAGNYTVTLTVTDDDGATDTAISTKTVA